jgi:hypothetical protein
MKSVPAYVGSSKPDSDADKYGFTMTGELASDGKLCKGYRDRLFAFNVYSQYQMFNNPVQRFLGYYRCDVGLVRSLQRGRVLLCVFLFI